MTYQKTDWSKTKLTVEKLSYMEDGIYKANAGLNTKVDRKEVYTREQINQMLGNTRSLDSSVFSNLSGTTWYDGAGTPSREIGDEGDYFFQVDTSDIYRKTSGLWERIGNIRGRRGEKGERGEIGFMGPQGDRGEKGERGDKGETGDKGEATLWYDGAGVPTKAIGQVGDYYLDIQTADIYKKTEDAYWERIGSLSESLVAPDFEGGTVVNDTVFMQDVTVHGALSSTAFTIQGKEVALKEQVEGLATKEALKTKANRTEIVNLATKTEVQLKADLTELDKYMTLELGKTKADKQELTYLATKEELADYTPLVDFEAAKLKSATKDEVALKVDQAVMEEQIKLLATKEEMGLRAYRSELASYATIAEMNKKANAADIIPLATKSEVALKINREVVERDYAQKTEVTSALSEKADRTELGVYALKTEMSGLATLDDLDKKANVGDLTGLATKEELSKKADAGDLTELATKEEVSKKADSSLLLALQNEIKELKSRIEALESLKS